MRSQVLKAEELNTGIHTTLRPHASIICTFTLAGEDLLDPPGQWAPLRSQSTDPSQTVSFVGPNVSQPDWTLRHAGMNSVR